MKLFKEKKGKKSRSPMTAGNGRAFSAVGTFARNDLRLFEAMRSSIPIIDAAILKIIRLVGKVRIECDNPAALRALNGFLSNIPTGPASKGIDSFVSAYLDDLLTYGTAVAEMVMGQDGQLQGLYNADLRNIDISVGDDPFRPQVSVDPRIPLPHPERILVTALDPTAQHPFGRSLLDGLPFVSEILIKIFNCIGVNWDRAGNLRYAVTYRPKDGADVPEDCAERIAEEWSRAMNDKSAVRDFVAVGDIGVKVIGAESPTLDSKIPVQQLLEQIVAKTGLPPFVLGLSWSTTERMSSQQADILTSELEHYRTVLTPTVSRICREFLLREGYFCDFRVDWNDISLQDEVELARARLYNAQADALEAGKKVDNTETEMESVVDTGEN